MKNTISLLSCLAIAMASSTAQATIVNAGAATGYTSTNPDWLSNTTDDIDGNGLGTDGFIFFGDFDPLTDPGNNNPGNDGNENIIGANANTTLFTASAPSYVTGAETIAANSSNVGQFAGYDPIDNPLSLDGTNEVAGNLLVTGNGSALEFTVSGLAPNTTVRVGVLGTTINDDARARFDSPELSLTDGTNTVSVTGLPNISAPNAGVGWVFFDINADGTYGIAAPIDAAGVNPDVTGIGGVTFDSIVTTAIPEPSSLALLGLVGIAGFVRRRR